MATMLAAKSWFVWDRKLPRLRWVIVSRAIHLHWLGHISPDDEQVGYDAAQLLAEQRQNKSIEKAPLKPD